MNKPIRCTTHFHACDCREYEFEQLRKEMQEKDAEIEKLISCLTDILTFKGPEYLKVINGKPVSIFSLVRECLQEERIKSFHAGYASQKEKIEDLQKENEELKRYKEQWQDIAGKANLKNLVATAEKLEKENEELKEENEELISLVVKIRDTIEKNNPEYFNDWVGEFVHSPVVCLERVYLLLKGGEE